MINLKNLPILTILVTSTFIQSCSIEKRTLLSGYHIEWASEVNNNTNVPKAEEQQNIALILPKESTGLSLGQQTFLFVNQILKSVSRVREHPLTTCAEKK